MKNSHPVYDIEYTKAEQTVRKVVTRDKLKKVPDDFTALDRSTEQDDSSESVNKEEKGIPVEASSEEDEEEEEQGLRRNERFNLRGNPQPPQKYGQILTHFIATLYLSYMLLLEKKETKKKKSHCK